MTDTQALATEDAGRLWKPVLAFTLFALVISLAGNFAFQRYKDVIRSEKQSELAGIAELKTGQITSWMTERRGDALSIKDDLLFVETIDRWLRQGSPDGETRTKLAGRLKSLQQSSTAHGYTAVSLYDSQARLRLSTSADEPASRGDDKARLLESMRSGQVVFSEMHRETTRRGEQVEIELCAPLTRVDKGKVRTIGVVQFRIDPYRFLFPLIQRWPTPSASAESLLVRRDGDEVVFLNELRHLKNTALAMRFPLSQSRLPAAMAVTGREGLVEGVDYRGLAVVGVLGKIPATSWFMVTKIDKAELYSPVSHLTNALLLLALLLVGAGGGIALFWRNKEKRLHENELDRQRLLQQLDYLSKFANDVILLVDDTGRIVNFNDRAVETYGYSAREFEDLYIYELSADGFVHTYTESLKIIGEVGGLRFESVHLRKNGERFPVESSVRVVDIGGKLYQQAIIRDITERKDAEERLRRLNRTLMLLGECNAALIHIEEEKLLLAEICKLVVETGGYRMAWVGFAEQDAGKSVRPVAQYGHDEGYLENASISWGDTEQGRGPTGAAIRAGVTRVNQDFQSNAAMEPWRDAAAKRGYQSSIALPLKGEGSCFGVLTIYATEANAFNADEIHLMEELAGNLAYGITALRIAHQRKQAEGHFENERTRLRTLVQAIPDLVWLKDKGGFYLACNQRFEQFVGAKAADIIGKTDYDFVDEKLADFFREHDRKAMESNKPNINEEWLTFASDGYRGLFETIKTPMRDNHGRMIGVLGVARDITERLTAAKAIQELNADLAATLKAIPDILFELGQNGEYINIWTRNPELLAAQKELLLGHTVSEMLPPEAAATVMTALREAEAKGYSHGQVIRLRLHHEDSWFELSTSVKTGSDASGKRFIMLSRDITDRKRTEIELRFKNTLLTTEQAASIDGILILDENGKIISYNRRFVEIWGILEEVIAAGSDERALQTVLDQLVDPEPFIEKIRHLYTHRDETGRDEIVLRDDRVFEYYTTPMIGPQEEYYGRIWYFHDVTDQKIAAKELAASYAQLQQLSLHLENARSEERARIALNLHDEMGATLAALKMRVAWLASKLPAESKKLVEETGYIAELVSDGIKTLRQVVIQLKPGLPDDVGVATVVKDYLRKYQQDMKVECELLLPEHDLQLDGNQSATLFRILQESLNNVAKHARADKVKVMITQSPRSLIMTVEDNGIGFDTEVRREQSFGLLGIRERALMVGGYAKINSQSGKGTLVTVCIPVSQQQDSELNT